MKAFLLLFFFFLLTTHVDAQHQQLRQQIENIASHSKGKIGVGINLLENNDTVTYQNNSHYVLQSVFKLAIAMKVLNEVDAKNLKRDQQVYITKSDLPKTHSALGDKYPEGNVKVTIDTLLSDMVSLGDNNACDILLKQVGGTKAVEYYVHGLGITEVSIKASEAELASAWPIQYSNWTEPMAQIGLLKLIYNQSALSKASNAYLWKLMLATSTGPNRIKGLLPKGTPVAHRTGSSGTNDEGLSPGTNDVGIIVLPNGKHLAVAVLITDSKDDDTTREQQIAKLAKAAYDEFYSQNLN